ncbi:MAG: hypothetical protein CVT80_00250 [Alphaproteobacteria bacterium HGW-Alphaproteobacteria-2]|nr:MAG: hypothetical protein CVT80_00250 [Alphaproteobacteria bacterium HGW-Alphaproteobacteria-2]
MPEFGRNRPLLRRRFQDAVNAERARRLAHGVVVAVTGHGPVALQGRLEDQMTLTGIKDAALLRAQAGDLTTLTRFRDRDNTDHNLAPMQVIEMWQLGAGWASAVYAASWEIKDMDPPPEDFTDDSLWPPLS